MVKLQVNLSGSYGSSVKVYSWIGPGDNDFKYETTITGNIGELSYPTLTILRLQAQPSVLNTFNKWCYGIACNTKKDINVQMIIDGAIDAFFDVNYTNVVLISVSVVTIIIIIWYVLSKQ